MKNNSFLLILIFIFTVACEEKSINPDDNNDEPKQIYNKFMMVFMHENPGIPQNDLHFFDDKNGISVGSRGSAFSTNNSGDSWTQLFALDEVELIRVYGIDKDYWFCSSRNLPENYVYKIENNQWTKLNLPPMPEEDYICSFNFLNKNIGYISTSRQNVNSFNDLIFKTEDGGQTWDTVGIFGSSVSHINMFDENNGLCTSGTSILKTVDGWVHWTNVTPDGLIGVYNYPSISRIVEIDNQHLIAVGGAGFGWDKGFVCTSSDGGLTWEYKLIEHTLKDLFLTSNQP